MLHWNSSWSFSHSPLQSVPGQKHAGRQQQREFSPRNIIKAAPLEPPSPGNAWGGLGEGCRESHEWIPCLYPPKVPFQLASGNTIIIIFRNIIPPNSWNTPRPAREKLHLFLRSCRAALRWKQRWLLITVKGLFCSHCSGRASSILCILGSENPLLTGECLAQLDKHRCFPEIPKHSRVQRLTFFKSTMLISAAQWGRACLQQDQLCLGVIEN